jgi:hypothetical protein
LNRSFPILVACCLNPFDGMGYHLMTELVWDDEFQTWTEAFIKANV